MNTNTNTTTFSTTRRGNGFDINEARFSGTVEDFRAIQTRTGTPMIIGRLRCWKETVHFAAFNETANIMLRPGDRVEISGRIQSTRWTAQDGTTRYGWQIVAQDIRQEQAPRSDRHRAAGRQSWKGAGPDLDGRQRRLPGADHAGAFNRDRRPGVMVVGEHEELPF